MPYFLGMTKIKAAKNLEKCPQKTIFAQLTYTPRDVGIVGPKENCSEFLKILSGYLNYMLEMPI